MSGSTGSELKFPFGDLVYCHHIFASASYPEPMYRKAQGELTPQGCIKKLFYQHIPKIYLIPTKLIELSAFQQNTEDHSEESLFKDWVAW